MDSGEYLLVNVTGSVVRSEDKIDIGVIASYPKYGSGSIISKVIITVVC